MMIFRHGVCLLALTLLCLFDFLEPTAFGQQEKLLAEIGVVGSVLDEKAPFDIITLKKAEEGRSVKVNPIEFPNRKLPESPKETDVFRVTFPLFPDRIYEIAWRDIEKITLYEDLVLQQANNLLGQKKFGEAFEHLDFLSKNYPQTAGLSKLRRDFLYRSALEMASQQQLPHALGVLEEFQRTFPEDKEKESIRKAISSVSSKLIKAYFDAKDYGTARAMILRLEKDYPKDPLPVVTEWRGKFLELAMTHREDAIRERDAGDFAKARKAALRMLAIEPDIEGGKQFLNELILAYPMIRVAVFQSSDKPDSAALADWPSCRIGKLISNPLFEFTKTGPEGGMYAFRFGGSYQVNDDRTELDLLIQNPGKDGVPDSLTMSQAFLDRATIGSPKYSPSWAAIVDTVAVFGPEKVKLKLRRPHVLPQAYLQWEMPKDSNPLGSKTLYRLKSNEAGVKRFEWAGLNPPADYQPKEIQEILYSDPEKAITDLKRGDVEMIDRLFPADATKLRTATEVVIDQYALPIVHMLIPTGKNAYLDDPEFRRALLYAINREGILNGEILGNSDPGVSRVISGPFPFGATDADPLSYAYNKSVENFAYDPKLAKVLMMLTKAKLKSQADKKREVLAPIPTIRLGVPDYESAKIAGEAIVQAWKLIEVPAELVVLDKMPGPKERAGLDFLYVSAAIWEPATDAERLFGIGGAAESSNQFIVQALGKLSVARNWREVREGCQDLHTLVASHLPILPLWQVSETFAYRREAVGVTKKPTALYQDIKNWRYQAR
ncbi:MAG: ABC transporter substrate-binding protein [Planctomycetota bacterium]|nr:ABC transporter substrate-binding protein [Planctomycetota bacterium]